METSDQTVGAQEVVEVVPAAGDRGPEFTLRAVLSGSFLGALVVAGDMYIGLKLGFTAGNAILAAILCFAIVRAFGGRLTILENNIGQTLASGAASMGIMVSVVPAMIMLGFSIGTVQLMVWLFLVSTIGVLFAIPLRKQFVVVEALPFPTGTACAATIRAMHAKSQDALRQARVLGISGLAAAIITWFRDGLPSVIPPVLMFPFQIGGIPAGRLSLGVNLSPMLVGAGLLIGPRIGASLFAGGIVGFGILAPILANAHVIAGTSGSQVTQWTMWLGIPLMVTAGFVSLLLKRSMVAKTFRSMKEATAAGRADGEFPFGLWVGGILAGGLVTAFVMDLMLQVPFWMGLIAIALSFILAVIAVRAYGETDISPIGTMGHATQIIFGGIAPGQTLTNVMTAGVTAGCANTAVTMMQDLKAGYLLGSTPRKLVYAQFIGVCVGSIVAVPVFYALVGAYGLGSQSLPAPAAILWSGMAKLVSRGLSTLPQYSWIALVAGSCLGILLGSLESTRWKKYVPSPLGLGIGLVVPALFTITVFIGSLAGVVLSSLFPKWTEESLLPLASGCIAGEAILGVVIAVLMVSGIL
jgi:putative OPT family oligopeptide transporter